jgi:hypothetical protein
MFWIFLLPAACAPALRADGGGVVEMAVPPGWTVARNAALLGGATVALVDADRRASVTIQLVRDTTEARGLPLDLLVETRALYMGRALGYESTVGRLDAIELDGREAWAATGHVRWHQAAGDFSLVGARAGRHVAFVTLVAPAGELDRSVSAWAIVLDTLRFPRTPTVAGQTPFDPD